MASPNSILPDDKKKARNSLYVPGEQAHQESMGSEYVNSGLDQIDAFVNDPENHDDSDKVREAEDNGGWDNNTTSTYGGNKTKSGRGLTRANFNAIVKKRGPLAAVIAAVLGGGIGLGAFFGPALLLVQIQESLLDKFDTQNTSMTIRSDKILANKITGNATSGACNIVQVACRFSLPSNRLLKNLEANGVIALKADGTPIERKGLFQTSRPASYTFEGETISAKEFYNKLRTNAAFRAAFHRAYNPRFVAFSDFVFKGIQKRFGFDLGDKEKNPTGADSNKPQSATEQLNESSKGANAVAGEAEEGAEALVQKLLSKEAGKMFSKIAAGGKGDGVGLVAATVCAAGDIPSLLTTTAVNYQRVQVIGYALKILTIASKLKAGLLTPAEATGFGDLIMNSVNGKNSMDSFGMQYTMFGAQKSSTSTWKKLVPGASALTALGPAVSVLSSGVKKDVCDWATNPATGVGINAALALNAGETFGATLVIAGVNIVVGVVASAVIESTIVPLIENMVKQIDVKPLMAQFLGDYTQNLAGEDVGNALVSGASNLMSQTANAGGNMPLSVADAVAYNQATQDVNIAYAEEDRATHSPFDPTNSNTMVGSIVSGLTPYLAKMGSLSGMFTSLISLPAGSFSSLLNMSNAHAASTAGDYSLCEDPAISDDGIAAGPFCNVQYGIPTRFLGMDPQEIVEFLVHSGDINPDTGEVIDTGREESLYLWQQACIDGANDQLKHCEITDDTKAMYSLYIIDHRIQKGMDEGGGTFPDEPTDSPAAASVLMDSLFASNDTDVDASIPVATFPVYVARPSVSTADVFSRPTTSMVSDVQKLTSRGWYWSIA